MNYLRILVAFFIVQSFATEAFSQVGEIDIQGHRGCRGLYPENSTPGFMHALDLGVTTLELDVVISKDAQVLLSHEPYISRQICLGLNKAEISEEVEVDLNIYKMDYAEIKHYDCGSKVHPYFPEQKKLATYKPLLSELMEEVEAYLSENNLPDVFYNIETKSTIEGDGIFHPEPKEFVDLLIAELEQYDITERIIIQSFDVRTLQVLHKDYPQYRTALLVASEENISEKMKVLAFRPDIISPNFSLVNAELLHGKEFANIEIVPWTVNEKADMRRLLKMGVKAIITDYPNRLNEVLAE